MKKLKYILSALVLTVLAACSGGMDDMAQVIPGGADPAPSDRKVVFSTIMSRTTTDADYKSAFVNEDEIGVYVTIAGQALVASGNYEDNRKLTYHNGEWSLEGDDILFPVDGSSLDFYAYYPYDPAMTDPLGYTFSVGEDQSGSDIYSANDFLMAKVENKRNQTIVLQFTHLLTLVNVQVVRGTDMPVFDNSLAATLENLYPVAAINLSTGSAAAVTTGDVAQIKMARVETGTSSTYNYRALVPAQSLASGEVMFTFTQETTGKEIYFDFTPDGGAVLTADKVSKWKITLNGEPLPPHEYSVGDVYPYEGTVLGIVFEVSNGGYNGKVVSLLERQNRWGNGGLQESTNGVSTIIDPDDGLNATRNLINTRKEGGNFATDYFVFNWLYTTMNDSDVQGLWYMPAKNELKSLLAAMSGITYADIQYSWLDGNAMPNWTDTAYAAARSSFNQKITDAGGTGFNIANGQYWATTEISAGTVFSVHFETGNLQMTKLKTDEWGRLRPIMRF